MVKKKVETSPILTDVALVAPSEFTVAACPVCKVVPDDCITIHTSKKVFMVCSTKWAESLIPLGIAVDVTPEG